MKSNQYTPSNAHQQQQQFLHQQHQLQQQNVQNQFRRIPSNASTNRNNNNQSAVQGGAGSSQTAAASLSVRARSVNAYHLSKSRKQQSNQNQTNHNSNYSQPVSATNNVRSASINKQFVFNNTNNDQMSLLLQSLPPDQFSNFTSMNNTTTHQQQQQLQAYLAAGNQLNQLQQNELPHSNSNDSPSLNLQIQYQQQQQQQYQQFSQAPPPIQTNSSIGSQYQKRSKHNKAFSMNNNSNSLRGQGQPINLMNSTANRIGATQQYLNQPLPLNQKALNQTLQYESNPSIYQNNNNYSTIGHTNEGPMVLNNRPNNLTLNIGNNSSNMGGGSSGNYLQQIGMSPGGGKNQVGYMTSTSNHYANNENMIPFSTQNFNNNSYIQNPFQQMKQASTGRMSNQRISKGGAGGTTQNNGHHIRSFSNCSKRDLQLPSSSKRGGGTALLNLSSTIQTTKNAQNSISEAQLLESEEYFEQGKVFLADKKYKEAVKAYTKSLALNKNNYDALFYRGVTSLDQGQPQKAIQDFNDLLEICPDYRKTIFIVLSIAYRRINDYIQALRALSKAIVKYPKYIEAYIARGQIYIYEKKWDKALSDFRMVISIMPENGLGYLGQGDSLKGIGNYNGALLSYSKAIEDDQQCLSQGLMKRGILYLQMKYSEQALEDFNKLTELAEQENQSSQALSKAYFYKAKALKKTKNQNDAILHFEQVMRLADDPFLQSSALYEIAKIRIQQKDFYEAYYNLKRATHFKLKQKKLINYKIFTEGVIFLMKRKNKTSIKLLTSLIEKLQVSSQQTQSDYITPLIYIYRAYGYFATDDYDKSLKDYIKSNQLLKLDISAHYNMIMCQGLKSLENKEYENSISFFSKAGQKVPGNRDPYFLRAVSVVRYALDKPIKPKTKNKMLRDAKRDLNRALKHSPKDYQVMYYRSVLNFALHYFYDSITDLETVIEKAEETSAKYYLARGRCYACLSMFKEAITDLSIAINLNKDCLDAYLNRGKCAYLIGDTGLAFMDFQKLIVLEPKNPMVHIYAGNLLMTTGSYEDATKAFTNADNIHKSPLALYQRSRCHVALNNMNESLKDLNKVIEISPNDKVAIADKECLNALKIASATNLQNPQLHEKSVYEKAIVGLTKLISYEKNEHLAKINHDSSILHQHSQIIPSAQRTKTDKVRAVRRRKEQDKHLSKQGENLRRNDLRYRVQQHPDGEDDEMDDYDELSEIDEQEIMRQNQENQSVNTNSQANQKDNMSNGDDDDDTNYYKENIFNKEDYYLYRAVMHFYSGDYEKSIQDFETSSSIMHASKVLYPKNQFPDEDLDFAEEEGYNRRGGEADGDNVSHDSSQTDLSDVGLCSLNIHEYSFNTVLCLLQLKEYKKALTKLDYMLDTIPKKYAGQIWLIRGIVNQVLGHQIPSKKDFKRATKYDVDNAIKFLEQKQSVTLNVFPQSQRLCNFYANSKFTFPGFTTSIYMKPSFSFPFIKPPNMIPCVDNGVLDQFNIKAIPLKPEAPWIKKCSFGIKFTEEIYFTDDDREATPDEDKEYKKRKQQQQQKAREATFVRSQSERVILRNNIFLKESEPKPKEEEEDEEIEYEDEQFEDNTSQK